jgi:lipopolysaccharide/colanic/teichoic acid biosynthesis glycosyltransferase
VTRVGRFLRRTSLDELPSLWNVLTWEMSLVGPRPHEGFEVSRYKPRQRRLLSMKPWITWYAQIKWRDALSFDDEANYDLYYMQHWSLRFDLYVLCMTIGVVLKGR